MIRRITRIPNSNLDESRKFWISEKFDFGKMWAPEPFSPVKILSPEKFESRKMSPENESRKWVPKMSPENESRKMTSPIF